MSEANPTQQNDDKKAEDGLEAARVAAPGGGALEATQRKVDEMKAYTQTSGCGRILEELYEKLVIDQPEHPIDYLIDVVKARAAESKESKEY